MARGACVIEKHFTLDRNLPGPDHKASLEPVELIHMIQNIRQVEKALGTATKKPVLTELKNQMIVRKSIVGARTIQKGTIYRRKSYGEKTRLWSISDVFLGCIRKDRSQTLS